MYSSPKGEVLWNTNLESSGLIILQKKRIAIYKKISFDVMVKRLIGELDEVIIIVPGDSAKYRGV